MNYKVEWTHYRTGEVQTRTCTSLEAAQSYADSVRYSAQPGSLSVQGA